MKIVKHLAATLAAAFIISAAAPSIAEQPMGLRYTATADRLYTLDCGLTEFTDAAVFSDTGEYDGEPLALPTPCFLIKHGNGWLLWDTGNGDPLAALTNGESQFGGRFTVRKTLASQLAQLNLKPDDIDFVAISHLHRDHTGNIPLFKKATFIIGASELAWARSTPTPFGVNFPTIEPLARANVRASNFDEDVFGDGSVRVLTAPGHTPGSRMLLVHLEKSGPVLITGDLYHTRENYEKGLVPLANTGRADTLASFERFKGIVAHTRARVVVQHAPEDFQAMPAFPAYLD
jgi:N-acyl homoserine lactone hydrolase